MTPIAALPALLIDPPASRGDAGGGAGATFAPMIDALLAPAAAPAAAADAVGNPVPPVAAPGTPLPEDPAPVVGAPPSVLAMPVAASPAALALGVAAVALVVPEDPIPPPVEPAPTPAIVLPSSTPPLPRPLYRYADGAKAKQAPPPAADTTAEDDEPATPSLPAAPVEVIPVAQPAPSLPPVDQMATVAPDTAATSRDEPVDAASPVRAASSGPSAAVDLAAPSRDGARRDELKPPAPATLPTRIAPMPATVSACVAPVPTNESATSPDPIAAEPAQGAAVEARSVAATPVTHDPTAPSPAYDIPTASSRAQRAVPTDRAPGPDRLPAAVEASAPSSPAPLASPAPVSPRLPATPLVAEVVVAAARPATGSPTAIAAATPDGREAASERATAPTAPSPPAFVPGVVLPAVQAFGAAMRRMLADERRPVPRAADDAVPVAGAVAAPVGAPAVPALADQPRIDTADRRWPEAMVQHIERLRDDANAADTRIRLHPDALGTVDVALRREGDAVHVRLHAAAPEARQLLADAQPRLSELAETRGLKLARTAVDGGDAGAGTPSQQGGDRRHAATPLRPRPAAARPRDAESTDLRIA